MLPMRVGVAFTPATLIGAQAFTEVQKTQIAQNVNDEFELLDFVESITLIPSGYLRNGGGRRIGEELGI